MAKTVTFAPQQPDTMFHQNNDDERLLGEHQQQQRRHRPNSDPVVLLAVLELDLEESLSNSSTTLAGTESSNQQQTTFSTKLRIRASELQRNDESPNSSHYASSSSDDSSHPSVDDNESSSGSLQHRNNEKVACSVQTLQTKIRQHLTASPHIDNNNNDDYQVRTAIFDPVVREHVPLDSFAATDDIVERFGTRLRIRLTEQPRQQAGTSEPQQPLLAIQGRYFAFDGTLPIVKRRTRIPAPSETETKEQAREEMVTLTFAETPNQPNAGTGFNVWDGALLLAHYLQMEQSVSLLENKRFLELGAGCGVAGLTAAVAGARHVTLTDLPEVLPLLESNVQRNLKVLQETTATVSCQACDWFQPLPRELKQQQPFDVILVADCVWTQDLVAPLLTILKQLTEDPAASDSDNNGDEALDFFAADTHEETAALLQNCNKVDRSLQFMDLTTASTPQDNNVASPVSSWADIYRRQQQRLQRDNRLWSSKEVGDEASCGSLREHETAPMLPALPLIMCQQGRDVVSSEPCTGVSPLSDVAADLNPALRATFSGSTLKDEGTATNGKEGPQVLISYQRRGKATHEAFCQGLHELFSHVEVLEPLGLDKPDVFYLLSCHR